MRMKDRIEKLRERVTDSERDPYVEMSDTELWRQLRYLNEQLRDHPESPSQEVEKAIAYLEYMDKTEADWIAFYTRADNAPHFRELIAEGWKHPEYDANFMDRLNEQLKKAA